MRKPLVIQLVSLVIAAAVAVLGSSFDASAAKKCITIGGKTVCIDDGQDKKSNNNNNPGNDGGSGNNDNPEGTNDTGNNGAGTNDTSKSATDKPLDCSKAQCDAGYVKLDKPNKYGACCEPAEGFCPSDRPNGTPPNCCPQGTTFREGACWPTECGPGTVGVPPHCDRVCPPDKVKVDQTCYDPCPPTTVGTPPNCKCTEGQYWDDAAKVCKPKCTGGTVGTPPNCQCPTGTVLTNGTCQQCQGGKVVNNGQCKCPKGRAPSSDGTCKKCEGGRVPIDDRCECPKGTMAWPNTASDCVRGTRVVCTWRGTAPFCDGSCQAGEDYEGAGRSPDAWSGSGAVPGGFGSSCASGSKFYCCRPAM
ncbi:MAG: hypothetical protein WBQ82_11540 [Methyloceanibacter sp.]